MRAVLDVNVVISALLSPSGALAKVLREWLDGGFELVASEALLAELERTLAYPKLSARIELTEARALIELLRREADIRVDPADPPDIRSPDPDDDYLIALAASAGAVLVSGDAHLLTLEGRIPVIAPAALLQMLEA